MSSGRAAKATKDKAFTKRTVLVMASEMAEQRAGMIRLCVQFEALAAAQGIKVEWDNVAA